ncbi:MAG: crotonase/enoyl-CoA hydratase family protein [Rhodospirillaceae bacterium]|nr:crotonase/enoyl-CoA hydratase family protein [Rhodospirillaceae bacterium]MBT3495230.1 crotonase/enoyl-CoA hydratase family protein [Rhodospirillaceae bacterium]MBT3780300.1 crotonase/enoyl-CoA hydratase family protein [Rhodospirillaceae bacterium]MBT3977358.1 crotonase/enoyl-CoA hydratase family protein [Rhodospirillaceae bacterium]MBT4168159.1 crotonase/enoyl-CoA hydratase family protein [Rhodospirillaceae bacterium]
MSDSKKYQDILYDVEDGVLTITLNRPDKLNAFTGVMLTEIIDAMDRADADDEVRAIIFTGAGRGFCAGADLSRGASTFNMAERDGEGPVDEWRDGGGRVSLRLFESKKPLIAAVNGPAAGVGVTMQLPMDIRIASTEARFGLVFTRRGVVMEACSSWFLPRIVGISQAMEWVMSGRVFPADEALKGGLVSQVVAPDDLLPTARAIAREIAENTSAVSVTLCRHMMWKMLGADHPMEAHKIDSRGIRTMGQLPDAYEGVQSFLEKRPGNYTMKPSTDIPDFFPWWEEREFE